LITIYTYYPFKSLVDYLRITNSYLTERLVMIHLSTQQVNDLGSVFSRLLIVK